MDKDRNDKNRTGNERRIHHLKELKYSDYKIAENQPNIDDWKILNSSNQKVGKVDDLLFDKEAMKVRYIVTNLKKGDILDEDRKVLIPIGQARLDKKNKNVLVPNVSGAQLAALPHFRKADELKQEEEFTIRNTFSGAGATGDSFGAYNRDTFYKHETFDEDRFYDYDERKNRENKTADGKIDVIEEDLEVGIKEVETAGARVTSRIVERPVEERVNLRKEHVEVKRNPVDRPASTSDLENFEEGTVEVHETSEVPVVNKEARVVEEVSLEKDVENKEKIIKDTVRKTEVDVDKLDDETRREREKKKRERETKNRDI